LGSELGEARTISHTVLLALTVPRSGTTLLHTCFREGWSDRVRSEHEPIQHAARLRRLFRCFDAERQDEALLDPVIGGFVRDVARTAETRPVAIFGNTLSHLAPVLRRVVGDRLRLVHLHRDPVVTAASIFVKTRPEWWSRVGRYEDDSHGLRITPFDPHAGFREYRERWASLSLFDVILYQWLERHAYALEAAERLDVPVLSMRSEDLFADPESAVESLARFAGLGPPGPAAVERARRNPSWTRSLERHPLGEEWRTYERHPAVVDLARRLGHPLDPPALEREMARYRLPAGILPWLRHRTGYWDRRERAAHWLRSRGIVPAGGSERAGMPPRSLRDALREAVAPRRRV
jgi:hypothetical protein